MTCACDPNLRNVTWAREIFPIGDLHSEYLSGPDNSNVPGGRDREGGVLTFPSILFRSISQREPRLYGGGGAITPHSTLIYMENRYRDRK